MKMHLEKNTQKIGDDATSDFFCPGFTEFWLESIGKKITIENSGLFSYVCMV